MDSGADKIIDLYERHAHDYVFIDRGFGVEGVDFSPSLIAHCVPQIL
jgi:hypothetical protein